MPGPMPSISPSFTGGHAGPSSAGLDGRVSISSPFTVGSGAPSTVTALAGKVLPMAILGVVAWIVLRKRR